MRETNGVGGGRKTEEGEEKWTGLSDSKGGEEHLES